MGGNTMALMIIRDAYIEYEKAVIALGAVTRAEDCEVAERECQTLKFHKKALKVIGEQLNNALDSTEFMAWCQTTDTAYRLFVYAEHFARPLSVHRPRTDFEELALVCFEKIKYLTTQKCLTLYVNT